MTDKELMALVNRYAEACDDLGAGLFEQTEAETKVKHANAAEVYAAIQAEVQRLHAVEAPKYTMAMGHAAEKYLYRVHRFANQMPQQFRWEECFNAMLAAGAAG